MSTRTPMSVQDSLWLTMDRPNNLMIIDGVMIMASNPGYDAVLDVARARIIGRFPVYQRKAVRSGGGWAWTDDPGFDLTSHVKRVRLPRPGNVGALHLAVNQNDALNQAINDGRYVRRNAKESASVSMDVQAPSLIA